MALIHKVPLYNYFGIVSFEIFGNFVKNFKCGVRRGVAAL